MDIQREESSLAAGGVKYHTCQRRRGGESSIIRRHEHSPLFLSPLLSSSLPPVLFSHGSVSHSLPLILHPSPVSLRPALFTMCVGN